MTKKLYYTQALRGIAALLVFFYHGRAIINHKFGDLLFSKGSLGVEIFFIISGFIMVLTTKSLTTKQLKYNASVDFFLKRLIRIAPLYYILTFSWVLLSKKRELYFLGNLQSEFINSLLFFPYSKFPIIIVGWTLNYEMFFYLLFAISLLKINFRYFLLGFLYCIIFILRCNFQFENYALKMVVDPIIDYFAIGVLFGLYLDKIKIKDSWLNLSAILSIVLLTLLLINVINTTNHYLILMIITIFTLSVILLDFRKKPSKPPKFMIYFGDISYSFYLIHLFVVILTNKIIDYLSLNKNYGFVFIIGTLGLALFLSKLSHRYIENYFSKKLSTSLFTKTNSNQKQQ